jgi:hypothetical protein
VFHGFQDYKGRSAAMKKKHRDITVNGVKYGWIAGVGGYLTIYKDKKKIWENGYKGDSPEVITPKHVAEVIRKFEKEWTGIERCIKKNLKNRS